jgi:hypothetical protein
MPSKSKQQQKFMGMAHALKKGEMKPSDASPELKRVAKSMSDKDVKAFASTSHKGLPKKVKQEIARKLREYANKMGTNTMGGDSIPSAKKGGLRDFDGYDNVDYNKDMPMDEVSSADVYSISRMLGTAQQSTQDFIDDNKIDVKKLESYIKKLSPSKKIIIKDIVNGSTDKRLSTIKKGLVKQVKESLDESMMSTIDQIRKDSNSVKDFIKKVLSDRNFKDMKGDKDFIKYLGSMYEGVTEGGIPNNWMQGRTSDYHTKLRGKEREYDDTNFEKDDSGQPDLKEENPCWDGYKQVGMKTKGGKQVPNCVKESINEAPFHALNNARFKKATSDLVKNKKIKNPETKKDVSLTTALNDKDHPAHNQAKSLFQRLKSKLVGEYGQRLDLSYLEDEEARLDGTPKPKDTIDRDLNETMIRRAVDIAQELLPKDTFSRYAKDGQRNKEFIKNVVRDLTQSLNRFYKNHDISVRIKENQEDSNVDMVLGVLSILKQIDDKENRKRVAVDMIKKFKEQNIDFDYKEFLELMREYKK